MTTIIQAFRPLLVTCFIIGLCVYPLNSPKSRVKWVIYLSILYSATVWSAYGYFFYYMVNSYSLTALFPAIISLIIIGINIITTIISVILNIYYNKRFQMCIKKLTAVDDTLKKLGSPKIYRKVHIWSKRVVIGWIVCSFVVNLNDTYSWLILLKEKTFSWRLIVAYIYSYCLHVNTLVNSIFIIFLWYIGTRFDEVNEHMQNLLIKKEHWLRNTTWKKPAIIVHHCTLDINNYKRVLWSSMHLHLELCRIAREWNLIFGIQLTFETSSYPLSVTALFFYVYKLIMYEHREEIAINTWFRVILWMLIYIGKMYTINSICENVSVKANKIDKVINELTFRYTDVLKEIYQFTLQKMHQPLRFTGMGFFYFGNTFLIKFCVTVTTYVIIMVQMLKF